MRHNYSGKRLGRNTSHRLAMMRNMVTSLIQHEKITTTDTKAKELRKLAERMVTLGKRNDLHARRQALRVIRDRTTVAKLFNILGPRYVTRPGGYTRIIKIGNRSGDNAPVSVIEFVEEMGEVKAKKTKAVVKDEVSVVEASVIKGDSGKEGMVEESSVVEEIQNENADEPEPQNEKK